MTTTTSVMNRLTTDRNVRKALRLLRRSPGHIYSGDYASFEDARTAIPPDSLVGYDNAELSSWYRERLGQVQSEDYPALFWLSRILPELETVFDFGGHVGLHYYAWKPALGLSDRVSWIVCDVPAVVESGRALATERGAAGQLTLTTKAMRASGATVFLASGSLQYLEPGFLWKTLASLDVRPRHLLLNKLPVHETRDFVTVQDTQFSFHPYSVVSRPRLTSELERLGYRRQAAWKSADHCHVLLRPDLDVPQYSGSFWTLGA